MISPVEIYLEILSGKRKSFPRGFLMYDTDNAASKEIVRFFIQNILELKTRDDILMKIRKDAFGKYKLGGLLNIRYKTSPSRAAIDAFPELKMQPWEFHEAQNNYWKGEGAEERAIEAFRFVYYEKLKLKPDEVVTHLTHESVAKEKLLGAIKIVFDSNLNLAIQKCFPEVGAYTWEIGGHVPNRYWNKERGIEAFRTLLEDELKLSREEICSKLSRKFMKEHNLYGMVQRCFNSNIYEALNALYPNEFMPWELSKVGRNFWTEETSKQAIKWYLETKLHISPNDAIYLPKKTMEKDGLYGAIQCLRHKDMREIVEEIYGEIPRK